MDPKEAKSSWAPRGMFMGQSTCSSGVELDLSAHERKTPGGTSGLCLGKRVSCSGGVVSSGSDVVGSLGVVTLTDGSTLGIGNGTLPLEVGAMGTLSATSNILRSTRLPLSITEVSVHRGELQGLICLGLSWD